MDTSNIGKFLKTIFNACNLFLIKFFYFAVIITGEGSILSLYFNLDKVFSGEHALNGNISGFCSTKLLGVRQTFTQSWIKSSNPSHDLFRCYFTFFCHPTNLFKNTSLLLPDISKELIKSVQIHITFLSFFVTFLPTITFIFLAFFLLFPFLYLCCSCTL